MAKTPGEQAKILRDAWNNLTMTEFIALFFAASNALKFLNDISDDGLDTEDWGVDSARLRLRDALKIANFDD